MNLKKDKYVTQSDIAKYLNKTRQWINFITGQNRFDTEVILGRRVLVVNQKLMNYLKECGK